MTDDELKAIEARIKSVQQLPVFSMNTDGWVTPDDVARDDAPKLVEEVRRLQRLCKLAYRFVAMHDDEGPTGAGWQSTNLSRLTAMLGVYASNDDVFHTRVTEDELRLAGWKPNDEEVTPALPWDAR